MANAKSETFSTFFRLSTIITAIAIIVGLFIFGFGFLDLLAIGLGIAGIFQKTRERITAIIGTIISSATLIITVSLISIGLAMG